MALGHLARSGGGPNYESGVLARSGSHRCKGRVKRCLARWHRAITSDRAREQFYLWRQSPDRSGLARPDRAGLNFTRVGYAFSLVGVYIGALITSLMYSSSLSTYLREKKSLERILERFCNLSQTFIDS